MDGKQATVQQNAPYQREHERLLGQVPEWTEGQRGM